MEKISIVLADDHPVVRLGIKNLLAITDDLIVVGEATTGGEALELVNKLHPDVLLLDMEMPDMQGVEVARTLRHANSKVRILGLSAYDDRTYILALFEQGAAGYLLKDELSDTILDAIRGIAAGETGWMSRRIAAQMSNWMRKDEPDHKELTRREMDVLRLVAQGMTNQATAVELGISVKTVEKHLDFIFNKLGVSSRVEAAVRAVRDKLV